MKNILKLMFAVGAVAQAAFGAGTWVFHPTVVQPPTDALNSVRDCAVDSKGTIWYVVANQGLFSQTPDNTAYVKHDLPAEMVGVRMGVFIDPRTDSLWVGGANGMVYAGKDGVLSAKPSIPLKYNNRYVAGAEKYYNLTHVTDFNRDSLGRLVASTDSLAWWLNGNKWDTIGTFMDYWQYARRYNNGNTADAALGLGVGQAVVDTQGTIWFNSQMGGSGTRITKSGTFLSMPPYLSTENLYASPDGNVYAVVGQNNFVRYHIPGYKADTIDVDINGEGYTEWTSSAVWMDEQGWTWVGMTQGMIKLVKNDKVAYQWVLPQSSDYFQKFWRSKQGDLWACTQRYMIRYSEKYSIPPEATAAIFGQKHMNADVRISTQANQLNLDGQGVYRARIADLKGRVVWQGEIVQKMQLALTPGAWLVEVQQMDAAPLRRTVFIP